MKIVRMAAALAVAAAFVATPVALADEAPPSPLSYTLDDSECGTVVLTLVNDSQLGTYVFDYRVDDEAGEPDKWSDVVVKEGPLEGQTFGLLYNPTPVPQSQSKRVEIAFEEDQGGGSVTLQVGVRRGPEQRELLAWTSTVIDTNCEDPAPPADDPPADDQPADDPPADDPPADDPPADDPPADEPPADDPPADDPLYADCEEVRQAGAAPLFDSQDGYRAELDTDADGVACEFEQGADGPGASDPKDGSEITDPADDAVDDDGGGDFDQIDVEDVPTGGVETGGGPAA